MIRNIMCVAAEGIVRDADSNSISIFNILEGITAQGFPLFVQRSGFFALWERDASDPSEYRAEFIVSLNGQQLHRQAINVNFQSHLRHRSMIRLQGLVVPQPGQFVFRIQIENGPHAEYLINVNAVPGVVGSE